MSTGHSCGGGGGGGAEEEEEGMKKGPWTPAEDAILMEYVKKRGEGNWNAVRKSSGLARCGKSCRLRWANHLRPNLKKGAFSPDEERLILQLHSKLGNKWARMAAQLPGRTDNEIKNYWNTRIKRRQRQGLPLYPPDIQRQAAVHAHRPPAPPPSLHLLDPAVAAPAHPMGFHAQSFIQNAAYNGGHQQVHHFLPPATATSTSPATIHRLNAGGFSVPFPSHAQMHPFLHQGPLHFGGAGVADLNPPPDAGVSIKLELPSSQNPDPGSALIYERPANDLDAFLLHSGHGGRPGSLLDPHLGKPSLVGWAGAGAGPPPPPSLNASSSNAVHWSGGGGDSNSDPPLPPGISPKEEEGLTTLFNIMPTAATAGVGEWCSDSGEASNSALTDDVDIGLDMQQLASSVSISAAAGTSRDPTGDKDWGLASCSWNNMPNIC